MIDRLKKRNIFYQNYKIINFINTIDLEKKLILKWRNNKNVRKWMVNKNLINYNEHKNYIISLKKNNQKLCFLIKSKNSSLGIIEFDKIDLYKKTAYFGLNSNITNKEIGIGKILMEISIYLAKEKIGLKKLNLYVFTTNKKAINLYNKFKFEVIKEKKHISKHFYYMEKIL
ncbi:MAG: UDP-4-amino-4,6-dideoxy-N-acetyl-beta-L-altrosamine N-acetyltransferase [Campylobacterota bacterium]|nr:UDP-4-amino-4,6-dideoxy-N-acetyl-beta-L-altrosamine N-acetyltransferase [Campylobacterota bacterium]